MSHESIPKYIREGLDKQGPETLRAIATLAEELAAEKDAELEAEIEERAVDEDEGDDLPETDEAPARATLTTKETHPGKRYYYWQWRDGQKIKSEYIKPVNPDE